MLHTITHLKAPWPAGARVGDVIDLPTPLPAWAIGKVRPAADDASATVELPAATAPSAPAADAAAERLADARQFIDDMRASHAGELQALQAKLDELQTENAELRARLDSSKAAADPLADADAQAAQERAELEAQARRAEAETLGIKVDGRWSEEHLADEIEKAKKAKPKKG